MSDSIIERSTKELIDSLKQSCGSFGLGNDGNEYKIIVQVFLYKYFNDKFGYEAKNIPDYGDRLKSEEKWDAAYDKFTDEEVEDLFAYLPSSTPRLRPHQTIAHLYNAMMQGDFSVLFDSTLREIAILNADIFSIATDSKTKITVFDNSLIATTINDPTKRDDFARSLMRHIADPKANFEPMFSEKYDFFSTMFEHLIKDYNKDGGGKYAEYYTPRSIAQIMARLLVGRDKNLRGVTCYDPSAGSGTLLMALAHQIGENRCSIYSQDISQKSSQMLRLNLILNNLAASIQNVVQGNTLLKPGHRNQDGSIRTFDFGISNPPFKLDFPEEREAIAKDTVRFWAGVPNAPKKVNPDKPVMKIFLCLVISRKMAWSLENSALNIWETEAVSMLLSSRSLTEKAQMSSEMTKITATISATIRKPARSLFPPKIPTRSMVPMAISAEPTPAQVRPMTERFSVSAGVLVIAGIIDQ